MPQIIDQLREQTGLWFCALPDHTRNLSLSVNNQKGESMAPVLEGVEEGSMITITAFRKYGVMQLYSRSWMQLPIGEYMATMQASSMVLHNKNEQPLGIDTVYNAAFPRGYVGLV